MKRGLLPSIVAGAVFLTTIGNRAPPAPDWPEGIYSDVRLYPESGDLGGFEVRFYEDGGRHMAEFVLCEGWCNMSYVSEVRRDGAGFVFEAVEELTSSAGPEAHAVRYRVTPAGRRLKVEGWYDGARQEWGDGAPLRRSATLFGLDVANPDRAGE